MLRWLVPTLFGVMTLSACGDDDASAKPCATSADCPAEMTCTDGRCSARLDGGPGVDLGPTEGGLLDGEPADLGPLPDVFVPDVGPVDLGPDDGVIVDLGAPDMALLDLGTDLGPPPDAGPARYPDGDGDRVPDALDRCPFVADTAGFYEGFELVDGWGSTARGPLPARFAPWPSIDIPPTFVAGPSIASSIEPGTLEMQASATDVAVEARAGGAAAAVAVPARGELSFDFETVLASGNAIIAVGLYNAGAATPTRGIWCGVRRSGAGSVVARELGVWLNVQSSPLALDSASDAPARGRLVLAYDVDARTATCTLGSSRVSVPSTGAITASGVAVVVAVGPAASDVRARFDDLTLQGLSAECP